MNYSLPEKIKKLVPYSPIEGNYRIRLDANESYLNLNPKQLKELEKSLQGLHYNRYPDPYAKGCCEEFAAFYGVRKELVTAGNGSDELIGLICGAFCGSEDKIGVFSNDFSMYQVDCEIYGVPCQVIPKEPDLTIDVDKAIKYIHENGITILMFSNPCNPTSIGMKRDEVKKLIRGVGALVVLDEAYMDFWDQSLLNEVEQYDNLLIMKTCSKAIGLAGIRVGFAVANETLTNALKAAKPPYNVNSISQLYAQVTLSDQEYLRTAINHIVENRIILNDKLEKLAEAYPMLETVYRSDTNFVFIKTAKAKELFQGLLNRSIAIRQMGDYLRISTGSGIENEILLKELEELLIAIK